MSWNAGRKGRAEAARLRRSRSRCRRNSVLWSKGFGSKTGSKTGAKDGEGKDELELQDAVDVFSAVDAFTLPGLSSGGEGIEWTLSTPRAGASGISAVDKPADKPVLALRVEIDGSPHLFEDVPRLVAFVQSMGVACALRDVTGGFIVPLVAPLRQERAYRLERAGPVSSAPANVSAAMPMSLESCDAMLEWVQQPPHSAAVWLHAKTDKAGAVARSCRQHVFCPAPAIRLAGAAFNLSEQVQLLRGATVKLFDSGLNDVSHALAIGTPTIRQSAGAVALSFEGMAILDVCRAVDGIDDTLSAADLQSKRGAKGWFHLRVDVDGLGPLWLCDGGGGYAKIVVKNERLSKLGPAGWRDTCCGPYADHSACTPSHVSHDGRRLCRSVQPQVPVGMAVKAEPAGC